jgi:hypothetical protein
MAAVQALEAQFEALRACFAEGFGGGARAAGSCGGGEAGEGLVGGPEERPAPAALRHEARPVGGLRPLQEQQLPPQQLQRWEAGGAEAVGEGAPQEETGGCREQPPAPFRALKRGARDSRRDSSSCGGSCGGAGGAGHGGGGDLHPPSLSLRQRPSPWRSLVNPAKRAAHAKASSGGEGSDADGGLIGAAWGGSAGPGRPSPGDASPGRVQALDEEYGGGIRFFCSA